MPFLKSHRKAFQPSWVEAQKKVVRNGFRIAAFGEKSSKEKFTGQFRQDLKHGKGVQYYENGTMYVGDWVHGQRAGHGVQSYNCGSGVKSRQHIGLWDKDQPNGFGMKYYPDGGFYRGDFKQGLRHGWGYMKYPNGEVYIGKWVKDKKWGPGRLTDPKTKNYYEGSFKKDVKCGRGLYFHLQTGQIQDGVWLADQARVTCMFDDKKLRRVAPKKTPFPIPSLHLALPHQIYREAANEIMDQVAIY